MMIRDVWPLQKSGSQNRKNIGRKRTHRLHEHGGRSFINLDYAKDFSRFRLIVFQNAV